MSDAVPSRYRWLKRLLAISGLLVLLLLGLRWGWGRMAHHRFESEVEELRALGEPVVPEDFEPHHVPDERNAARLLQQALNSVALTDAQQQYFDNLPGYSRMPNRGDLDRIREMMRSNAKVFELVHQARNLPEADWNLSFATTVTMPNSADWRQLGRLLCLRAAYQHEEGDDAGALATLRDGFSLTRKLRTGMPTLVTHLITVGTQTELAQTIETIIGELRIDAAATEGHATMPAPREAVEALLAKLQDEDHLWESFIHSLQFERMTYIAVVRRIAAGELSPSAIVSVVNPETSIPLSQRLVEYPFLPLNEMNALFMLNHIQQIIRAARERRDWPAAMSVVKPLDRKIQRLRDQPENLKNPNAMRLPIFEGCFRLFFSLLAERRMAATALAIRLYELDHDNRPETLTDLVPDYLDKTPRNPMAAESPPIQYEAQPSATALTCVDATGPDLIFDWVESEVKKEK